MTKSVGSSFGFSQISGDPSFRSTSVNAVALIPLLSSNPCDDGEKPTESHSSISFRKLWEALRRHSTASKQETSMDDELLLVVANSSLTRPGDWRYQETPLKAFHWQYGCQRLRMFDGRPEYSRLAQDRLWNPTLTRDWIDLCPSRRTAAVIGILNLRDCPTQQDFDRAQEELHQWATQRYATPPYQVTAHGKMGVDRDQPVERLFVFDSFDEDCQHINLEQTSLGASSILAFPPALEEHSQIMDLHLNVVINDLAVAIFISIEAKIKLCDEMSKIDQITATPGPQSARRTLARIISAGPGENKEIEEPPTTPSGLSVQNMAGLVSPENRLAKDSVFSDAAPNGFSTPATRPSAADASLLGSTNRPSTASNLRRLNSTSAASHQLLTPIDDFYEWSTSQLSLKDADSLKRRDMARREKMAADLSLLVGSPLDAYERYLKAAHVSKTHTDPLWYAMAMVGCAASHICMAEMGGYNVDEYLANNFSLPEDILQAGYTGTEIPSVAGKQTFPDVVFALCEEALAILNRHPRLAPFHAGLLLQLALYSAHSAESHLRCRWGEGPGNFGGEAPPFRWAKAIEVNVSNLKTKGGRDMIEIQVMKRIRTICESLQKAVSVPYLDPATRIDIASRATRLFLEGIPGTKWKKTPQAPIRLQRKAAFFAVVAAEAMSKLNSDSSNPALENLWIWACKMYTRRPNSCFGSSDELGSYAWATLRASTLHALSLQGNSAACLEASEMLLNLLEEIQPKLPLGDYKKPASPARPQRPPPVDVGSGQGSEESQSVATGDTESEENYTSSVTKLIRDGFTQVAGTSSVLTMHAKWASEAPRKAVLVPMAEHSIKLLALPCVWHSIGYFACAGAQGECANRIATLKKLVSRSSSGEDRVLSADIPSSFVAIPLSVSPRWSLKAHDDFDIEIIKRKATVAEADKGVMATFYNPFEKSVKQRVVIPVAADEERVVTLSMKNWLTVPLTVKECRLDFGESMHGRINSVPVSFIVPPLAIDYPVQFPFTIISAEPSEVSGSTELEVQGISFSCLNHRFTLSLFTSGDGDGDDFFDDVPKPASYPYRTKKKKHESQDKSLLGPKIEVLPCQPRLKVRYSGSRNSLHPGTKVPLGVTSGELVSTPMFELANSTGPKGRGLLGRLQVGVIGIPGISEKIIFDTASTDGDESKLSEVEFMQELSGPNPPAVKVRMLPGIAFSCDSLNSPTIENMASRTMGFQIALADRFGDRIGGPNLDITIRIRYAGNIVETKEIWRKFDLPIALTLFRGPRVTSVTFRADLNAGHKLYPQVFQRLEERRKTTAELGYESNESDLFCRVGLDRSVHVISSHFLAIVTVMNDSSKDVVLSRRSGAALSLFASTLLPSLVVPRGVTVSIPMSVPRLSRANNFGDEIVQATSLLWQSVEDAANPELVAQGRISVKKDKLSELISKSPSFIPSIFEPPCTIQLEVQGTDATGGFSTCVSAGEPIDLAAEVSVAPWVSTEVLDRCELTVEFFAVWLETSITVPAPRDQVWSGKVCRRFELKASMTANHSAQVILLQHGRYALSACVRLTQDNKGDEVWLSPSQAIIVVDPSKP